MKKDATNSELQQKHIDRTRQQDSHEEPPKPRQESEVPADQAEQPEQPAQEAASQSGTDPTRILAEATLAEAQRANTGAHSREKED